MGVEDDDAAGAAGDKHLIGMVGDRVGERVPRIDAVTVRPGTTRVAPFSAVKCSSTHIVLQAW